MRRLTGLLLPVPLLAALLLPTAAVATTGTTLPSCPVSGPAACFVTESHTPQVTVPGGTTDVTYADFAAKVTNNASSTVTHFRITDVPFPGATVSSISGVDATGGAAACMPTTGACSFGSLPSGKSVTVDVVLAISSTAVAGTPGTNTLTLALDEGTNDNPGNTGGKTDFASIDQYVDLLARDGLSVYTYVPAGLAGLATLTTDKGGKPFAVASLAEQVVGTTEIPAHLSAAVLASLKHSSGAGSCPTALCAMTDWLQASVPDFAATAPTYLKTVVRVDSSLVATLKSSNPKTLSVYYRHEATDDLATLPFCTFSKAGLPAPLGCYTAVQEKDGDLTVTVYEPHNGFIRL
jgi:hypothetical protein